MRVLIADDSATSRLLLRAALGALGHECVEASDGAEALEIFTREGADVIVSDWMMPGLTGEELCRRIRISELGYTYFILLTSLEDKSHALAGMEAGADDYLSKPLNRNDLEVRLGAAARVTALHRRLADQQTQLEHLNATLFVDARTDGLTGAANRMRFDEDLAALEDRAARYGHRYSIAFFDVDRFKLYNDTCGHAAGDDVLRSVTAALSGQCRTSDALYRYGGEELVVILTEQTTESAAIAVERMRAEVQRLAISHPGLGGDQVVTVSAGVAGSDPAAPVAAGAVVERADLALYRAKEAGRNRVVLDEVESDQRPKVLLVEPSLTQALASRAGLESAGFVVRVVTDPRSALAVARQEHPDAVVAGLDMPGLDGAALCQTVRADPHLSHTPVVLRTSRVTSPELTALLDAAAPDALVDKSVSPKQLASRLTELISSGRVTA
ncbi:MAG: diguanylate cyclase [Solirubrobacterales bacterium]|nr:diguanylate cyclase [Solirubrobacterales bacterium]